MKQMDVLIRAWHPEAREVKSGYYGSVFVGYATVVDLLEHFNAMKACV